MQFIEYTPGMSLDLGQDVAIDCETDSLDVRAANLICVVIANTEIAVSVRADFLPLVSAYILTRNTLYLQNFGYDFPVLKRHGLDLYGRPFLDTMLLHHLVDENAEHSLDAMVKHYFEDSYKEVFWGKYKTFAAAPATEALEYVCKDGIYTAMLAEDFLRILRYRNQGSLIERVHGLAKALHQTEMEGVRVDVPLMQQTKATMGAEIDAFIPKLRETFSMQCSIWEMQKWREEIDKRKSTRGKAQVKKPKFNFGSDTQVSWLLYKALKLPVVKKTKKGNPGCDYDTIEKLEEGCPELKVLKDYKGVKSVYATFVDGMLDRVVDGRIYPRFNINGTVTGRISSSNPNMQNMPKEGVIRHFFLPSEGHSLIGADYSQLEVAIAANLSGDKMLTKSIMEGISLHDITSQGVGVPRDIAKTLNFAVQYGAREYKIAKILKCSVPDAKVILGKYWETYSGLKVLVDACHDKVDKGLPIISPFNRYRHFPTKFDQKWQYEEAKRQAFNSLIQGTGADITHTAFTEADAYVRKGGVGRGLWPVHDEILLDVDPDFTEESQKRLKLTMENVGNFLNFAIPLTAKTYGPLTHWAKT